MAKNDLGQVELIPIERIAQKIYLIRGVKVMLDSDLAELYQVPTKAFNQAVRRNADRFPDEFMFQLTREEASVLRSKFVTLERGRDVAERMEKLEATQRQHASVITFLAEELEQLKEPREVPQKRRIGFHTGDHV